MLEVVIQIFYGWYCAEYFGTAVVDSGDTGALEAKQSYACSAAWCSLEASMTTSSAPPILPLEMEFFRLLN